MHFDLSTAASCAGFIITMLTIVWQSGGQNQKLNQVLAAVQKNEADTDTRFNAVQAQISLMQAQMGDIRENIAINYMRKPEIGDIEKRVNDKQKEIIDTIRDVNKKVDRLLARDTQHV
jgi:methyl-accepting chemotaxis protein